MRAPRPRSIDSCTGPLAFPEVFNDADGEPLSEAGFDAISAIRRGTWCAATAAIRDSRESRRDEARYLTDFVRESGVYRIDTRAHVNRYQLFVERALQLARRAGASGSSLPGGAVTDSGSAPLRRSSLRSFRGSTRVIGLDNRHGIFPIHRSVRFVLLTCTTGEPTDGVACRFGITRPEDLDDPAALDRGQASC